jgi:hypothetical protein
MAEAFTIDDVVGLLLEEYHELKAFVDQAGKPEYGPNNARELAMRRSVLQSFRYIQCDPEGFKAFCAGVRRKWGEGAFSDIPPPRPPTTYLLERIEEASS